MSGRNNAITDTSASLTKCLNILERLVKQVAKADNVNTTAVDKSIVDEWKKQVVATAMKIASLINKVDVCERLLAQNVLTDAIKEIEETNVGSSDRVNKHTAIATRFNSILADYCSRYNTLDDTSVRNIMQMVSSKQSDDDIEIEEQEENENTYKCPFTHMRFVKPMKNNICIHRISQTAVTPLFKTNPTAKCPVVGCKNGNLQTIWTKSQLQFDLQFEREMNRFFERQATNVNTNETAMNVDELDDEGYTQI